jgi:transcriptional regulator with XRE-family HTH domain
MAKDPISIERGKRIRTLRDKVKLSRLQFEEMTGMSASTLRSFESGDRNLTTSKARLFSNLFSSLFNRILGNDTYETSFDYIFYGKKPKNVELGNLGFHTDDTVLIQNEINIFATNPSYNVIKIRDELMSPIYKEGDIVVGRKITAENQFALFQGCICIIETLEGEIFLRKLIKVDKQKVTSCILNTQISQHTDIFKEIEVRSIAQAIRHWHLSEFVQTSLPSPTKLLRKIRVNS